VGSITAPSVQLDQARLQQEATRRLAREYFLPFVKYTKKDYQAERVHKYVAKRLQQFVEDCEQKRAPRLIFKMPPQHGKSEQGSRRLPGWILGRNPRWRIGLMSYGADWARRLARDARDVFTSEEYQEVFPGLELDPSSTAVDDWALTRKCGGGGMTAVGRDGAITGRSLEVLIVDDPVKNQTDADSDTERELTWANWTGFRNRVQHGGGVLIVATQWHHDDLIGRLLQWAKDHPDADQYEVINLTALAEEGDPLERALGEALAPSRYDVADLLKLKASMPDRDWQALYCGRPSAEEGAIFNREWFQLEDDPHAPGFIFQTADTAYSLKTTADYSVIQTWRREKNAYRLLDVYRARCELPELKRQMQRLAREWKPLAIWVEDIGSGKSLIQELREQTMLPVLAWKPDRDKVSRAHAVTPLFAAGKVRFPKWAPWLSAYLTELENFPLAAHDDQVDATTMALTLHAEEEQPLTQPVKQDFTYDEQAAEDEATVSLMDELTGKPAIRVAFTEMVEQRQRREQQFADALP
jgi:predicted phage terminase large subunit-like protein